MRVLVVDQEFLFSEALATLLARMGHEVVCCLPDRDSIAATLSDHGADALLVTCQGSAPGSAAVADVRAMAPNRPIVALCSQSELGALLAALNDGAHGVCLKADGIDDINAVLEETASTNGSESSTPVWSRAARAVASRRRQPHSMAMAITEKEQAVLSLLIAGASTGDIAESLRVREATVRTHLQHLFGKFGVHTRLALVAQAVRSGTVDLDDPGEDVA